MARELLINKEEHKTMSQKIDDLGEGLNEIKVTLAGLPEKLADKFDERYASKEYEESLKKIMWLVISGFIIALLAVVIK